MEENKYNIDDRLWEYIDGSGSAEERSSIEKLLETNREWKEKYHELLEVHQLMENHQHSKNLPCDLPKM